MKTILIILITLIATGQNPECGDGITYSNENQTKYDKRLANFPKIESIPTYLDGNEELNKLIEKNLKISEHARDIVFRLNYLFTITCDGQITDFKILGDSKLADMTNIQELIEGTKGKWIPAEKDTKPVDCIYFSKKTIIGNKY